MALVELNFESSYLRGNTEVWVVLPDRPRGENASQWYRNGRKYPVIWLLHGGGGDCTDWVRKSRVELFATEHDLAVVMFSGYNSMYTAWPTFADGMDISGYFTEELMPMIQAWFPVSDAPKDNYLAGLSMGGAGALKFMTTHPERFAAVTCLSSSARDYRPDWVDDGKPVPPPVQQRRNAIRNAGGAEAFFYSTDNTRQVLREMKKQGRIKELPPLLMACGTADHHYDEFTEFTAFLKEIQMPVTVKTLSGYRHEWRFWDWGIQQAIQFFMEIREGKAVG